VARLPKTLRNNPKAPSSHPSYCHFPKVFQ